MATDTQRETALQDNIDDMSARLLDHDLHASSGGSDVQNVARTRTISVLTGLDADHTGTILADANLTGARVSEQQLATAMSLSRATLPDGTTHD